jgi:hypothetical protein
MRFEEWREWGNPEVAAIVRDNPHLAGLARRLLSGPKFMREVVAELQAASLRSHPAASHVPVVAAAVARSAVSLPAAPKSAAEEMAVRKRADAIVALGAALGLPPEPARLLAESTTSIELAERVLLQCTPDRGWSRAYRRVAGEPALSLPPISSEIGWPAAYARVEHEQRPLLRTPKQRHGKAQSRNKGVGAV